jgi:peptidyl-prolyl cis-trans isomerase B (cyclophilin B)
MSIKTNLGTLTVKIDRGRTPCAAASFTYLAGLRFYDKTTCHRLTTTGIYILQCGDPSGTGAGGPSYQGRDEYPVLPRPAAVDESMSPLSHMTLPCNGDITACVSPGPCPTGSAQSSCVEVPPFSGRNTSPSPPMIYPRGVLAMANSGPDTNGSQFFIVYRDSQLPADYTEVGAVTSGIGIVDAVAKGGARPQGGVAQVDGKPKKSLVIETLTVTG